VSFVEKLEPLSSPGVTCAIIVGMDQFLGWLITVFATWFLSRVLTQVYDNDAKTRGEFAGDWIEEFEDIKKTGNVKDRVLIYQKANSNLLEGSITRIEPKDEQNTRYKFRGVYKDSIFFGHYWNLSDNGSFGAIVLLRYSNSLMKGYYVKMSREAAPGGLTIAEKRNDTLTWTRLPKKP
jgi:hypothetical protein